MRQLFQDLKRYRFAFLLVFFSLIALLYIILTYSSYFSGQDEIRREFVKLFIQLLLIVIFGGIFVQWYNLRSDRAKALNEFRKNFLTKLTDSYFKVKKARRILEGIANKNKENSYSVYETQIIEIIDAQLEFESLHNQLAIRLFNWDEIPTKGEIPTNSEEIEMNRLKNFLKQETGLDWVNGAKIEKIDNCRLSNTIKVSVEKNYLLLSLNNEKNKMNLKIQGGPIRNQFFNYLGYIIKRNEFVVIKENGKIFKVIPYIFSDKNTYRLINLTRTIEDNLNDNIINEYKKLTTTDSKSIAGLNGISWLINIEKFRTNISYPFHECVELIQGEILNI